MSLCLLWMEVLYVLCKDCSLKHYESIHFLFLDCFTLLNFFHCIEERILNMKLFFLFCV